MPFADRLADAVRALGPLCVGIDPRWESLPISIRESYRDLPVAERVPAAFLEFGLKVLELISPHCQIVKPQAAFFEQFGPAGMRVMQELIVAAKSLGCLTILDAKRGDIASTAQAYADAAFAGPTIEGETISVWDADALTVNPYLGEDAIEPFATSAIKSDRGLFVLVRTSNAGSGLFQNLNCDGKPLYRHVGDAVNQWNASSVGQCGLGAIGAVVGATHPRELAELRQAIPDVWFLIPGYGAQGGTTTDVAAGFKQDGLGAIINSSRGVTFPFKPDDPNWETAIVNAVQRSQFELKSVSR